MRMMYLPMAAALALGLTTAMPTMAADNASAPEDKYFRTYDDAYATGVYVAPTTGVYVAPTYRSYAYPYRPYYYDRYPRHHHQSLFGLHLPFVGLHLG